VRLDEDPEIDKNSEKYFCLNEFIKDTNSDLISEKLIGRFSKLSYNLREIVNLVCPSIPKKLLTVLFLFIRIEKIIKLLLQ